MLTIHQKIKLLRSKHGYNQIQVAEKLNCSVPAYSKIETGATDITDYRLRQLGELYGMRVSEIYEYGEPVDNEKQQEIDQLRSDMLIKTSTIANLQSKVILLYEERFQR